jgi:carbon storage regulator
MLVLSRHQNQSITMTLEGQEIRVVVIEVQAGKVRLGVEADRSITVHRTEVAEAIKREQHEGRRQ